MTYIVLGKYVPPAGTSEHAPGEHYTLRATEMERHIAGQGVYRHYRFYRTRRGSEVAASTGFDANSRYYWPIDSDSQIFRDLKQAVEDWEAKQAR